MTEEFDILVARYFEGTLSGEEKERLSELYNQNDSLRRFYVHYKNIQSVTHPPFNPDSIDLEAAEQSVMRQIHKHKKSAHSQILVWWQKIAAILLIPLLAVTLYLWVSNRHEGAQAESLQVVTSLPGTRSKVNLPDGSKVWLNSGSTLTYLIEFNKKERRTILEGEGYFIVEANPEKPFYISTNEIEVMITGTELNVEGYPGDSLNRVILASGSATVTTGGNKTIVLKPDQCFSLNTLTGQTALQSTDAALYGKWKDGILAFRDETLENVFKRIGRTFNVDIRVTDSRLAAHKYRATFEDESLQQILDAIKLSAPIKYKYVEQNNGDRNSEIIEVCHN
ncbi:MAG: DUF4974 domain-containing protein [Proteiniphilum sp.]|nr:DUF4974 domain-containing protein [Proteiniphilum sp.]MDD3909697.1 DUF4974 domain-containing protein [Proteiniphilum sp.]